MDLCSFLIFYKDKIMYEFKNLEEKHKIGKNY
jgi:hypothetical protein